ncbi:MAG: hypothetical protein JWP05_1882 [Microbacteriaceae bacterium]|nr:hypothetical protein [Microbacteriaceae bacterium]
MSTEAPRSSRRDTELRRTLVAVANADTTLRIRPRTRTVIAAIAAFALAGALSGGAVSAIANTLSNQPSEIDSARAMVQSVVGTHDLLLGTPRSYSGMGNTVLDLGRAPAGANGIAIGFDCIDRAQLSVTVDSSMVSDGTCEGTSGQEIQIVGASTHSMKITSPGSNRYAVYAAWVRKPPPPGPSAAQTAAMSDGKVTRAEYLAAFNRYAGCMTAAGYPLQAVPDDYVYYPYAITDDAVSSGADDRCYPSEFQQVDAAWQLYVQDAVAACLVARSAEPLSPGSNSITDLLEQLLPLHLTFDQCAAEHP